MSRSISGRTCPCQGTVDTSRLSSFLFRFQTPATHPILYPHTNTPLHRTYKAVATSTASSNYRSDLRAAAVARASALRQAQRPKKEDPAAKPRGAKARKAADVKEE